MHLDLQKILNYSLMILAVCGGVVFGGLSGQLADLLLSSREVLPMKALAVRPEATQLEEDDFQVVLDRNLFDAQSVGKGGQLDLSGQQLVAAQNSAATAARAELTLIGTVVAGNDSLALIQVGRKAGVFRLEEEIAPGIKVLEISRQVVSVRERGIRRELVLKQNEQARPRVVRQESTVVDSDAIVPLGENRWQVSRAAAENARANLNSLLQTARMVPELQDGQTIGFKLVEMDRGSLLEQIGLQVGDLLVEINQVELNSPEKALQIFQQVREANNISLGLVRNGQRQTFEYRFE